MMYVTHEDDFFIFLESIFVVISKIFNRYHSLARARQFNLIYLFRHEHAYNIHSIKQFQNQHGDRHSRMGTSLKTALIIQF